MTYIDSHCHLNFDAYDDDRDDVVARARAAGVDRVILPGIDAETSHAIVDFVGQYAGTFGAVGYHPNSTARFQTTQLDVIRQLASNERIIAIGEIGLDYYWDTSPKDTQRAAFEAQLELAATLGLPVIIHNREAHDDVIAVLEAWAGSLTGALKGRPGVLHSFSAPQAVADRALAAGFYLGFTGPVTFKNADGLRRVAAGVPLDRILVETDGPFLTPHPHRGKRNEPSHIPLIVDRLAGLHRVSADEMAAHTTRNTERLFALPA